MSCGASYILISKLSEEDVQSLPYFCLDTCDMCGEPSFAIVNGCGLCEDDSEMFGFEKGRGEEYHWLMNEASKEEMKQWFEKNLGDQESKEENDKDIAEKFLHGE